MGIPWPSRSHLGSDLAQTFHARQFSWCHVSCCAARGAQVRLVMTTHRALGIIVPSTIKMQPCQRAAAQQQVGNCGLCREVCGWCWPRGRRQCPARTERHMCQAQGGLSRCLVPKHLGSWPGLILPLSILLQSQSHRFQTTGLGGRVPQAHPRILTR